MDEANLVATFFKAHAELNAAETALEDHFLRWPRHARMQIHCRRLFDAVLVILSCLSF